MKFARVLAGVALGALVLIILWFGAIVQPPEILGRKIAVYTAVFPGDVREAEVGMIPCDPIGRIRLYVVCTDGCRNTWRIVAVKGLQPRILADLGRIPREAPGAARRRFNLMLAREALQLDHEGAREMIGCYLRLDGLDEKLILPEGGRSRVQAARGSEERTRSLISDLDHPDALSRLSLEGTTEGFESEFDYWDTSLLGRPVVEIRIKIARNGQVRSVNRSDPVPPVPPGGSNGF